MSDVPHVEIDAESIPDELKRRDQWLFWNARADKPRKPLPEPDADHGASWTDPDEWWSFGEALAAARDVPAAGIGYVFANSSDEYLRGVYGALDLDGCVTVEDGHAKPDADWLPSLEPFARETYMELSPSGTGIHIPLPGFEPPDWWSNVHLTEDEHEGVEAYGAKFFTVTGDQLAIATDDIGDIDPNIVEDWLAEAYENITGEDPRATHTPAERDVDAETRGTKKSRDEVHDIATTTDYDDVLDAVDHLEPHDLPLRSSYQEDENSNVESWDPAYRDSKSGISLKRWKDTGLFIDMAETDRNHTTFGPLDLFAAEEGIIRRPWRDLTGDDWHEAVDRAREKGAPIPEFVGGQGDLPDEATRPDDETDEEIDGERLWELWAEARASGEFGENKYVPRPALRYIAREHANYPMDDVPEDELPWGPHNAAITWLIYEWGPEHGIDPDDDEDVTATSYKRKDPQDTFTWKDVRSIYDDSKEDGRYAAVVLLRRRHEFLTPEDTEELHIYDPDLGIFDRSAEFVVGRKLDRNMGSHYSQHEKQEIIGRLKEHKVEREDLEAGHKDGHYVCVENGVLDLDRRELRDHSPDYLFTTRLPHEYDPGADGSRVLEFLQDVTRRDEDWKTMVEMVGNCLLDNYEYESFLVLFGEGSNGKSTWYEVVREFLGDENVTSMSLQQITDTRFAASNLVGKWANIGEDLPEKKIQDLGTLKDLTGGGETHVEPKGKQGFDFRNRAKMMFAANRPPVLGERTKAVSRRLLPIRLPYQFTTDPDDDHKDAQKEGLLDELTTDEQMSGLLNLALDGLERLRATGEFSLPEDHEQRLEYYEQYSDHIKNFAVNCLENKTGNDETKETIYNAYTAFCEEHGYEMVNASVFWTQLRKTTLNISERRPSGGDRRRIITNIAFTDFGAEYVDEYSVPTDSSDTIASLAPGDDGVRVEGEVVAVEDDTPEPIAQKVTLRDTTDEIVVTAWDDANVAELDEGECYRLKNVSVGEHDGHREIMIQQHSAVESIKPGVGNAPSADPGHNEQLDAAADGGQNDTGTADTSADDGGLTSIKPKAVQYVREQESEHPDGVPREMVLGHLVANGAGPDAAQSAIDSALEDGRLLEPESDQLLSK